MDDYQPNQIKTSKKKIEKKKRKPQFHNHTPQEKVFFGVAAPTTN
jgi:hypothetical protein